MSAGELKWKASTGRARTTMSIASCVSMGQAYILLAYEYEGKVVKYRIDLQRIRSNLGRGYHWKFVCPTTGRQCLQLHFIQGKFLYRRAVKGFYSQQTLSHSKRQLRKEANRIDAVAEALSVVKTKYFKKHYAGKKTRRYRSIERLFPWNREGKYAEHYFQDKSRV